MDNDYGRKALKKMLTEINNKSTNALVDGSENEYSNIIQVIDRHLTEKMDDEADFNDIEDILALSDADKREEQTKDHYMYCLVSNHPCQYYALLNFLIIMSTPFFNS